MPGHQLLAQPYILLYALCVQVLVRARRPLTLPWCSGRSPGAASAAVLRRSRMLDCIVTNAGTRLSPILESSSQTFHSRRSISPTVPSGTQLSIDGMEVPKRTTLRQSPTSRAFEISGPGLRLYLRIRSMTRGPVEIRRVDVCSQLDKHLA